MLLTRRTASRAHSTLHTRVGSMLLLSRSMPPSSVAHASADWTRRVTYERSSVFLASEQIDHVKCRTFRLAGVKRAQKVIHFGSAILRCCCGADAIEIAFHVYAQHFSLITNRFSLVYSMISISYRESINFTRNNSQSRLSRLHHAHSRVHPCSPLLFSFRSSRFCLPPSLLALNLLSLVATLLLTFTQSTLFFSKKKRLQRNAKRSLMLWSVKKGTFKNAAIRKMKILRYNTFFFFGEQHAKESREVGLKWRKQQQHTKKMNRNLHINYLPL